LNVYDFLDVFFDILNPTVRDRLGVKCIIRVEISVVFHLIGLGNELLLTDFALEWLDSSVLTEMDLQIVSGKVSLIASLIMTFISMFSGVNAKVRFHQFSVFEHFLAPNEDALNLLWVSLDVAEHVVLSVLLLLERFLTSWLRTLEHSNLKMELQMLLKRFVILKVLSTVMDDARNILLNLVNLAQAILFWNDSKNRSWIFRLHHFLMFSVLVLGNSLIGQLDFNNENFPIFMEQWHPIFIYDRIFFLLIIG